MSHSMLSSGDTKMNSTHSDLEWLLPGGAKAVSEHILTATYQRASEE